MSVPNTTTFTLQDVVTEVNPTTDDLNDCFNDAIASYFNSAYEGSKNQLLNFAKCVFHKKYNVQKGISRFICKIFEPVKMLANSIMWLCK